MKGYIIMITCYQRDQYGDGRQLKVVVIQGVVNYCLSLNYMMIIIRSLQEMMVVVILFQGRILSSGDVLHKKWGEFGNVLFFRCLLNLFTCKNLVTKICPSLHSIPSQFVLLATTPSSISILLQTTQPLLHIRHSPSHLRHKTIPNRFLIIDKYSQQKLPSKFNVKVASTFIIWVLIMSLSVMYFWEIILCGCQLIAITVFIKIWFIFRHFLETTKRDSYKEYLLINCDPKVLLCWREEIGAPLHDSLQLHVGE